MSAHCLLWSLMFLPGMIAGFALGTWREAVFWMRLWEQDRDTRARAEGRQP